MPEPSAEVIEAAAEAIRVLRAGTALTWENDDEDAAKNNQALARAALNAAGAAWRAEHAEEPQPLTEMLLCDDAGLINVRALNALRPFHDPYIGPPFPCTGSFTSSGRPPVWCSNPRHPSLPAPAECCLYGARLVWTPTETR